jgi:hypothetical protein
MAVTSGDAVENEARKRAHTPAKAVAEEPDEPAPPDMTGEYKAYGHFRSRNMPCLHLYYNAAERRGHGKKKQQLQYGYMEADDARSGFAEDRKSFSVVFTTSDSRMRLTVGGRNLEYIYDLITYGKMAWVRSIDADRDFPGLLPDGAEVITSIRLTPEE